MSRPAIRKLAIRVCIAGAITAVSTIIITTIAVAQAHDRSVDEEIEALDRSAVELLKNPNELGEAQGLAHKALEVAESGTGKDSAIVAQRLDNLAFTIRLQHRYDEAQPFLLRALSIREKVFGYDSPDLCQSLTNLAVLHELKNEFPEAQRALTRCLTLQERAFGADHPAVGHTLCMLAKIYQQAGRAQEADELRNRAEEILGPNHPATLIAAYESGKRARDKTFFGQISDYHWTGMRLDNDVTPTRLILLGEATFNNGLWNLFETIMDLEGDSWKLTSIRPLSVYWKVRS